ncbi:MAG: hypothetical protein SGILL_003451 [Bacillariaceae sp.]
MLSPIHQQPSPFLLRSTAAAARIHLPFPRQQQQQQCAFLHSTSVLPIEDAKDNDDNGADAEEEMEHHHDHHEDEDIEEDYFGGDDDTLEETITSNTAEHTNDLPITEEKEEQQRRIWIDPKLTVQEQVTRFVTHPLGEMHPLDITVGSLDLIKRCGKLHSFEGMKLAQDILDRLIEEKRHCNSAASFLERGPKLNTLIVVPDRPFQWTMYGWANLCKRVPFASQRMRQVLELMIQEDAYDKAMREEVRVLDEERQQQQRKDHDDDPREEEIMEDNDDTDAFYAGLSCEPTVQTYNTLLQGLTQAATRSIQAAIEAESVLQVMDRMSQQNGWHTKPNTRSYSLVLNAYAKCRHRTAGDRAESVLRAMTQRHEEERRLYLEDYEEEYDLLDPKSNRRRIVTPDVVAYTSVIQAHGNSNVPGAAEKALGLLSELIHSNSPNLQPDAFAFANTINVFSKMAAKKASPDARIEAAQQAEDIWWLYVEELKKAKLESDDDNDEADQQQRPFLQSSIVPFNSALKAHAVSFAKQSPHSAEDLLHRLLEPELQALINVRPDTVSFNTCIQAWANASKVDSDAAPERAEEILKLLQVLASEEDADQRIYPDVQSYAAVMDAYAVARRSDSIYHARRLLNDLLSEGRERYLEGDKQQINAVPFTVMLKAVAKADRVQSTPEDPFGVEDDDGLAEEGAPTTDPYAVALETYTDMLNDVHGLGVDMDHFVFAAMLDVVAVHTKSESVERRQRTEEVFQDACQAGQVSSLVVKSLQKACPSEHLLKELLELSRKDALVAIESINSFPRQWTRFVPSQFRRITNRSEQFRKKSEHYRKNKGNRKKKNDNPKKKKKDEERKRMQSNKDFIF